MKRRLFALFLALVTVLQPVLPAAAESLEPEAETTAFVTEEVVETTAVPADTVPAPTETTQEVTVSTPEETTIPVVETTAAAAETTAAAQEPAEPELASYAVVRLVCGMDGVTVHVYPAVTEENPEPEEILPQEDGSYHLLPGEYVYSAEEDDKTPIASDSFLVTEEDVGKEIVISVGAVYDVFVQPPSGTGTTGGAQWKQYSYCMQIYGGSYMADYGPDDYKPWSTGCNYWVKIRDLIRVGSNAFRGEAMETLELGSTVQTIGTQAFQNCKYLRGVDFPDSLRTIESGAFSGTGLVVVGLPAGVRTIMANAFADCPYLDRVLYGGSEEEWKSVSIASGNEALRNAEVIYNFSGDAVKYVSTGNGSSSCDWILDGGNQLTMIGSGRIPSHDSQSSWSSTKKLVLKGSMSLPSNYTSTFSECTNLEEVEIYNNASLGQAPFKGCQKLRKVTFPDSWVKIPDKFFSQSGIVYYQMPDRFTQTGQSAFENCTYLKYVNISDGCTTIDERAFYGCSSLKSIYIPASVTLIGDSSLYSVSHVYYGGTQAQWNRVSVGSGNSLPTPEFSHVHSYDTEVADRAGGVIYVCECGSYTHEPQVIKPSNIITASDLSMYTDSTKAQTISLNATALGGAVLSYQSSTASVTVSSLGIVTVAKGFSGTANITITAGATADYKKTTKTVTVTVKSATDSIAASGSYGTLRWELTESGTFTLSGNGSMAYSASGYPWKRYVISDIRRISIGDGVTSIAKDAFWGCEALENLTLGSKVQTIGEYAFFSSALTQVVLPASVRSISYSAFSSPTLESIYVDSSNTTYCDINGVLFTKNKETLVLFPEGRIGTYIVPSTTRKLAQSAFSGTQLAEIQISEGVTDIGQACFAGGQISKVTLPGTLRTIGKNAFFSCAELKAIDIPGSVETIGASAFDETGLKEVTIGNGVTSIGEEAFLSCPMTTVTLPESVTSIGAHAIGYVYQARDYQKIEDFIIRGVPGSTAHQYATNNSLAFASSTGPIANIITASDIHVYVDDFKAQTVALNASALGGATLSYRSDNASVTVSTNGIATIAKGFKGTAKITITTAETDLYLQTSKVITLTVSGAGGTFENLTWKLDDEGTLTISGSGEMEHASPYPWEAYQGTVRKLIVKTGVTSIARSAFSSFEALEEVVLADTVTTIDESAFFMCGKLSKLNLGSGLRVIYSYAFEFCESLKEVNLPASASSISPSAFENCGNLQSFHVASGNETYCDVDGVLFWSGKVLLVSFPGGRTGSYTVPSSVKTIGDCAFYASKLTEVVLPSGLKTIGDYCFRYSTVSQLTLPAGLANLGVGAFEGCKELETVAIPGSVKTVSDSAFWGSGLKSVTLEDGITTIGKEAFLSCGLTKVDIPSSVTSIGEHALGYEANRLDYDKVAGFTIFGVPGSAAQRYADSNGFPFKGSSTITYDANGGTGAPAPTEKNRGSTAYLSSTRPAKAGYQFAGWAESPDAATAQYQPGGSYTKDEDITLYAVWKANTYSIRFYANDGTQASVTQSSLKYDAAYTLRANTFQRTGYVFLGWAKTANGQVIYTDQAEIQNLTQTNNATVALYAQWQANRYQVRFDLNGGSGTVNPISAEYGKTYSLPSTAPARAGYTLSGWNTKADGKGTGYALDAQISNLTAEDGGSVTLYAVWKANTYSIRYYANDGTQSSVIQTDLNYGAQYALRANSFTWKGRVFLGWAETADGAVQYTNSEKVQNLTTENGAVVKLYAQWRLVTYQVRFDANGGVGTLQGIRVTYGDAFRLPEADALTRELYSFSGWTAVIGGVTKTYQPGTELRDVTAQDGEVITFKAVWTPNFGTIGTVEWVLDSGVLTISGTGRVPDYSSTQATPWAKAQVSSVQIGEGITYVGSCAFSGCASLTAVSLPASLQGIGANAFRDCGSSLRYTYAGTLAQWGDISFAAADDPTASGVVLYESGKYMNGTCGDAMWKLQSDGTLRISGTGAAKAPTAGTGWAAEDVQSLVVEEGITEIGGSLFRGCGAMKTAALPRSLQTVGANAFSGCNALTTIRYSGKQEQWDVVSVGSGNEALTGARLLLSTYLITYVNVEGAQNPNPDVADKDKALTLKDASKTGYTFGGWYREASFQTRVTSIPAGNEEDVTLYAKWTPIRYTVNFNANGGDGSPSQASVSYDEALTLPGGSFSRTGYVLTGWNTAQDGTGTAYESSQEVVNLLSVQGASETLYAQWRPITYRVEFDLRGGEGQIEAITVQYDESFTVPTKDSVRRIGYTFYSWLTDKPPYGSYTPGHNAKNLTAVDGAVVTLHPYWYANCYFVEFRAMNGSGQCVSQGGFRYDVPRQLNFNTFQWKGYTFIGWAVTPQGPVKYADGETVVNLTDEDMRTVPLFARWSPTTYYLNLDANGGTGAPEKVTMHYGTPYTLPTEQDVRRPGYMLTGWKGKIGKSTKTYKPGAELRDLTTVEGEEFTLTAQWGPLKYTVRFEPGEGGTGKVKTQAMTYGKLTALASNGFKRPGYVFAGWRGEDGTLYDDKEKVSDLTPEPNGVVVLTAQWKPNAYQLVFDPNGGTGELPGSGSLYTCGVTYRIPDSQPVRTGYRFLGWSTKAKGDVMYESGDRIRDLATVNGKTVTLYAVWAPKQYAILFGANGGSISVYPMFDQTCGKAVTLPSGCFTRPGYVFTGWNTKADGTGTAYKNKEKVTFCTDAAAVILYAQWQEIHYTVTYKNVALGSEGGNPTSYTMAEGLQLKDGFTRGMTFEGWYLDAKFNTPFDGFKPGDKNARNVTVYAKWFGYSDYFFVWYYKNAENPYTHVLDGLDKTLYYSQTYTLRANTFKRPGYRFLGWSRDPNAKVPEYTDKQKVGNLQPDAGAELNDISLYAIWEPIQYTITYKGVTQEEIRNLGNPETFTAADKISLKKPSRPGYRFDGWYTTAKFKGSSDTIDGSKSLKNLTLYAKWTNSNTKYTVAFDGNGAASGKNSVKALSFCQDLKLTNMGFKRTGYQFLGWSTDPKAKEPMYLVGQTVHDLTDKAETVTLYAVWEAIAYTVTLKNVTGANVPGVVEDTLTYTADGLTLPIPSREGAVFEGWYTTANFKSGTSVKRLLPGATGDLTLYAKWRIQ